MRVVEVQTVGQGAVDQRGLRGRAPRAAADEPRLFAAAPTVDHGSHAIRQAKASGCQANAEGVEQTQLDAVHHLRWQSLERRLDREVCQALCQRPAQTTPFARKSATCADEKPMSARMAAV